MFNPTLVEESYLVWFEDEDEDTTPYETVLVKNGTMNDSLKEYIKR